MDNKLKFRNKKVIGLTTLASFCLTTSLVCLGNEANASMISRAGNRAMNSIRSSFSGSFRGSRNGLQRPVANNQRRLSGGSARSLSAGNNLSSLQQRLNDLEIQRDLDVQRNKSPFNKAVLVSGLIASGAVVAGTVGGVIQQSAFIGLTSEQSKADQKVQEDLTNKRYELQEKEMQEAEQYIIDYYKEHYGIDVTQKN